jgi:hypothetical protein
VPGTEKGSTASWVSDGGGAVGERLKAIHARPRPTASVRTNAPASAFGDLHRRAGAAGRGSVVAGGEVTASLIARAKSRPVAKRSAGLRANAL